MSGDHDNDLTAALSIFFASRADLVDTLMRFCSEALFCKSYGQDLSAAEGSAGCQQLPA
jgi:hypothetical protein